jgi:hypothetical protein
MRLIVDGTTPVATWGMQKTKRLVVAHRIDRQRRDTRQLVHLVFHEPTLLE